MIDAAKPPIAHQLAAAALTNPSAVKTVIALSPVAIVSQPASSASGVSRLRAHRGRLRQAPLR